MGKGEINKDFYCSGPAEKCIHYPDCEGINFLCESFHGNTTEQTKQIGNAVPVNTARALAKAGMIAQ